MTRVAEAGNIALARGRTSEAVRKAIHAAAGVAAAALALLAPPLAARGALAAAALLALTVDLVRLRVPAVRRRFDAAVGSLLRPAERTRLTGATTLAAGAAITTLIFPGQIAAIGILYAAIGDAAAAIVGSRFGRRFYRPGRTLEGTLAFFGAALAIGWAAPDGGFLAATGAALAVTFIEAAPLPLDDNLLIPVAGAAAYWAAIGLAV